MKFQFSSYRSRVLSGGILSFLIASAGFGQTPERVPSLTEVRSSLQKERAKIQSVQYTVADTFRNYKSQPQSTVFQWANKGEMTCKKSQEPDKLWTVKVYDGAVTQEVRYFGKDEQKSPPPLHASISRLGRGSFDSTVPPLEGVYSVEGEWISEIVRKGEFTITVGANDPRFGKTLRLKGISDAKNYDLTLAPQRGWMCIAFRESYLDPAKDMVTQVTLMDAEKRAGIWLPTKTRYIATIMDDGKRELWCDHTIEASIERLNDLPDAQFQQRKLREGASVTDRDTQKEYRWKGGKLVPKDVAFFTPAILTKYLFFGSTTTLLAGSLLSVASRFTGA
jgi:hypothetical protein